MTKGTEELKIIIDLAQNGGKMEAKNEILQEKMSRYEKDTKRLENENKKLRADLTEKTRECDELKQRNKELEAMMANGSFMGDSLESAGQNKVVVVNNYYYVLSWLKTIDYMGGLDADHRMFAGHMILHTLADGTPPQVLNKVNEVTRLENLQDKRLADAIEKVAERPTTEQNVYGDIVENKTEIPNVGTYNAEVKEQSIQLPAPAMGGIGQKRLADE